MMARQIVVPRQAIKDGAVCVLDEWSRIRRRLVKVAFEQDGYAVISSGIEPGQTVVVDYPQSLIEAGIVNPIEDRAVVADLQYKTSMTTASKTIQADKAKPQTVTSTPEIERPRPSVKL